MSSMRKMCLKVPKYGVFSGPYFPAFGLNTERYEVSLRIQSKCGKIRTKKYSVFGHFSRGDFVALNGRYDYCYSEYSILTEFNYFHCLFV